MADDTQVPMPLGLPYAMRISETDVKGLGAIPSPPDSRDYQYISRLVSLDSQAAPEVLYRDLRRLQPPIYDQGSLGSCTANAVAGAIEYLQWVHGRYRETPSRLSLYYDARRLMGAEYIN